MLDEMTCQLGWNEVPGTSVKLAMHGVLSGVDCSEREHPTLRGADGSTYSLRSFSILFSVLFVFMAVHRLHSGRDMRSDFMTCCTSLVVSNHGGVKRNGHSPQRFICHHC